MIMEHKAIYRAVIKADNLRLHEEVVELVRNLVEAGVGVELTLTMEKSQVSVKEAK